MSETVSLPEAAELLGVHYMTAYRYVRTGVLPAAQAGSQWRVALKHVDELARRRSQPSPLDPAIGAGPAGGAGRADPTGRSGRARHPDRALRLERRLVAGDEGGAWRVVGDTLASGSRAADVLLELIAPAMRRVGEEWEAGTISVADEHRASAVAMRLVGRLGPMSRHRGLGRGTVVVGAPPGERHQLPVAIAADVLRSHGFDVIDLGCDVPAPTWAGPVRESRVIAAAIGVTSAHQERGVRAVMRVVEAAAPTLPRFLGGAGVRGAAQAASLSAVWSGRDAASLARAVEGSLA